MRHLTDPQGKYICASVADTGTGMAAETVEKIFDPYFTTKATGEGTGLGLSIVKHAARSHGGRVEVESQLGVGSVFRVQSCLTCISHGLAEPARKAPLQQAVAA